MLLTCNNKGCRKLTEAKLDPETNEIICSDCGMIISGLTDFVKNTLRSNKDFVKKTKGQKFAVECKKCSKNSTPILIKNKYCCPECKEPLVLSRFFENALRDYIK